MSTEKDSDIITEQTRVNGSRDDCEPVLNIEEPVELQATKLISGEANSVSKARDGSNKGDCDDESSMDSNSHSRSDAEPNFQSSREDISSVNDSFRNETSYDKSQGACPSEIEEEPDKDVDLSCRDVSSASDDRDEKCLSATDPTAESETLGSKITPKLKKNRLNKLFKNLDDLTDVLILRDDEIVPTLDRHPKNGSQDNDDVISEADAALDMHSSYQRNEHCAKLPPSGGEAESHFVEVSLHDPPRNTGHPPRVRVSRDSVSASPFHHSANISPKSSSSRQLSFSSLEGGSSFTSPMDSPLYQRREPLMPNASPVLMHLVDSAIQLSDPSSLQKLRNVVSGEEILQQEAGEIEDWEDVAMLVVDILVAKMGGVEGLFEGTESLTPQVMLGVGAAVVAGNLIPWLPSTGDSGRIMSPRTKMIKCLALVLQACTRNRAMCSAAGLLQVLLEAVRIIFSTDTKGAVHKEVWDVNPLLDGIEILSSHCLSVLDLRQWLNVISDSIHTGKSLDLIISLEKAMSGEETRGPTYTFEFDGESSGLLGPSESRWPFVSGYAFATWLYIESFADTLSTAAGAAAVVAAAATKTGKSSAISAAAVASALAGEGTAHMPRLFSFLSADNHGVEAYFHGQFLVVESASGKGRKASLHFTHAFKPRRWYFVGLEHTFKQTLLGKGESEFRLYLDGHLYETRPLDYPRVSKGLAFCCIGTNPPPTMAGLQRRRRQCPLFAEMGPIYIFREPVGQERMARLARRGGDFLPMFGSGAGISRLAANDQATLFSEENVALDSELAPQLHLLYHPKLLVGRSCMDASPLGASGVQRRHAEVLGHVHVAARTRPTEALWAMADGGPLALLSLLIDKVDTYSLQPFLWDPDISSAAASSMSASSFRIISLAFQHHGNPEEMLQYHAPQLLAHLLGKIVRAPLSALGRSSSGMLRTEDRDEELVAAVVSLCQAPKQNAALKVQLYSCLLLDIKLWCRCAYGLQKKLLSSLSDMVFTDELTMRAANAVQLLLDGCRRCYWVIPEADSIHMLPSDRSFRHIGEINALVDELLIIIELMMGSAPDTRVASDMCCLLQFALDCPQANQVARVLHLLYRLVVQPNTSRSSMFADWLVANGGLEMLLNLLYREGQTGDFITPDRSFSSEIKLESEKDDKDVCVMNVVSPHAREISTVGHKEETPALASCSWKEDSQQMSALLTWNATGGEHVRKGGSTKKLVSSVRSSARRLYADRNIGGISLSISADSARKNFQNIDSGDGIMVGVVSLLGALVAGGHVKLSTVPSYMMPNAGASSTTTTGELGPGLSTGAWILYALQKAFQAAPNRLFTDNVYTALLAAVTRTEAGTLLSEDRLAFFDSGHRLENSPLLLGLLRSLPYASTAMQLRALQDILLLASTHPENRSTLTMMTEWPEWLLEILISNYEAGSSNLPGGYARFLDIEDLIYGFLTIMLEHSMRMKDGWKDVEAAIHCAEWLAILGGSSIGEQRTRREESLPVIKRRLLGSLLDFAAGELQKQSEVVAAVAAGVAAENLSPKAARAEAELGAHMSMSLSENSLVLLMLVEDHLRLQCQAHNPVLSSAAVSVGSMSPVNALTPSGSSLGRTSLDGVESFSSRRFSSTMESSGLSAEVLSSMVDVNGQFSAASIERLSASVAAEPYESVRCAFVSYGSSGVDLAESWKRRSRMWYGVGLPSEGNMLGGCGGGWESWNSVVEKGENGEWVDLPLVKKSLAMLQALLLDDSGPGGGGGGGMGCGGAGTGAGAGGLQALQHLLDSDQPFFAMLRMVLLALREEDQGDSQVDSAAKSTSTSRTMHWRSLSAENIGRLRSQSNISNGTRGFAIRRTHSALLWCILAPLLTMPISEARRQRVLVAACVLYSEVLNAVSVGRKILRKQYVETIMPAFTALLRRWRPLLSGMHELTDADGQSPLAVEDRALATDALASEAALAMVSPAWAAAFASPPAAMALAMAAAGVGGGEMPFPKNSNAKRETSNVERKVSRLRSLSNFLKYSESSLKSPPVPKDKAAEKAAALAAVREQERAAKIGSGRGLGAVAMASSAQRRAITDRERAKRWNTSEAMNTVWVECFSSKGKLETEALEKEISEIGNKAVLGLSSMVEAAWRRLSEELERRTVSAAADEFRLALGAYSWCSLVRRLLEVGALFGEMTDLSTSSQVFWKLDSIENSIRMRRRLKRNYKGTDHYGASADHNETSEKNEEIRNGTIEKASVISLSDVPLPAGAPKLAPEHMGVEDLAEEEFNRSDYGELEDRRDLKDFPSSTKSHSPGNYLTTKFDGSSYEGTQINPLSAAIVTATMGTDATERIFLEIPAAMIKPLRILKGRFQVTSKRLRFFHDENVSIEVSNEEVIDINSHKRFSTEKVWHLSQLVEVHSRRYLLRKSALELFMADRTNAFFTFGSAEARSKVYKALIQAHPPHLNTIFAGTQKPERLLKRTQLMEKWARREINNFEYLMQLNTLAGRTYNDISQYPIFPWILADYTSEELSLDNPMSYRDLSKPVGALNETRLAKFLERYHNFDDPVIPKFHYGSHYSSAGTVLYYLVRLEPYTTLAIQLQGGKFDHADRMFGDLYSTWNGVLEDMSDVKELVPELFYLPEILTNSNGVDLGRTQTGERIGNVKLPAWAKSSVDFVQKHRAALESEYVSAHLHEWVDLIFGYKQRGKEAIDANNMFFYMTYEGTVDIDKIVDPALRKATQDQIAYFGQTPSQLLTSPHIRRKPLNDILHLHTIFQHPNSARVFPVSNSDGHNVTAGKLAATHDSIILVDRNSPVCRVALHKWKPNTPDGQGMPFLFQYGKAIANSGSGAIMRMFRNASTGTDEFSYPRATAWAAQNVKSEAIVAVTNDGKLLLTGGHADNSMKVVSTENARVLESAFGHSGPIACLALSSEDSMVVTGSRDTTAMLWKLNRNSIATTRTRKSIPDSASQSSAVATLGTSVTGEMVQTIGSVDGKQCHIEGPLHILRGHTNEITCCCISLDLDLVVTFSAKTGILLHSITKGRLIRRIAITRVDIMALSSEGIILVWDKGSHTFKTFTMNGIAARESVFPPSDGNVTAMAISADGLNFVIGTEYDGSFQHGEQDAFYGSVSGKGQISQVSKGIFQSSIRADSSEPLVVDGKVAEGTTSSEHSVISSFSPSVILLDLYTLKILHRFRLQHLQNVTAIALNQDNTNLIVSTTDGQLLVFTDPALSIKIVNKMLVLAGEGSGLASYLT